MIPAHFVFAADKKHSGIALLIYLMKRSPKKSSFLKLPAKKKTPIKTNKNPGLESIVSKLTTVAVAQQLEKGDVTPIKKKMPVKYKKSVNLLTSVTVAQQQEKGDVTPVKKKKSVKSKKKCGQCDNCKRVNCGSCIHCLDMPRFGGNGKMKQACKLRKCLALVTAPSESSLSTASSIVHSSSSLLEDTAPPNKRKRVLASSSSSLNYPGPSKSIRKKVSFIPNLSPVASNSSQVSSSSPPAVLTPRSPSPSASSSSLLGPVGHLPPPPDTSTPSSLNHSTSSLLSEEDFSPALNAAPDVESPPPSTSSDTPTTWTPTFVNG